VRGDRWRYTRFGDGSEELFDHRQDPQEWENLAGETSVAQEKASMQAWLERLAP
jgi:iduronate 2-sulfatase